MFKLRAIDPMCKDPVLYSFPDDFSISRSECCVYHFEIIGNERTLFLKGAPFGGIFVAHLNLYRLEVDIFLMQKNRCREEQGGRSG